MAPVTMAAAYASVSQSEHETPYDHNETANDLANSPSPELPQLTLRPLSLAFENISGEVAVVDPAAQNGEAASHGVGGILKSLSSGHSYEMVEDDDYEEPQPTPTKLEDTIPATDRTKTSEQAPVRTSSVSRHLPLSHPTPDLHSMQGGYKKNVERLEESAERLSMTSSIDEEIQKMKSEQRSLERRTSGASSNGSLQRGIPSRQFSSNSISNSIIGVNNAARTGGYSPSGYMTSPTGSIRSGSWARPDVQRRTSKSSRLGSQIPESDYEGRPLDFGEEPAHPLPGVVAYQRQMGGLTVANDPSGDNRPPTAASHNTQEGDPFADFDGAYHSNRPSLDRDGASLRRISLNHPPLARDSKAFKEQQPGEKMIYYPAPVPVMLNLPTRLSKMNFGDREKRRLQALSGVPEEMRKSAAWLNNEPSSNPSERQLRLPPQLRASAFFDQPGVSPNLKLKNGSAVQTLDSILDAAAHAPVSAFTDHPIAGRLGKEVYGTERQARRSAQLDREVAKKAKRRSSLSNILKSKKSSDKLDESRHSRITSRESKLLSPEDAESGDELEKAAAASLAPGDDELVEDGEERDNEDDSSESTESEYEPGFSEAPTTLLAELQMRKSQQKKRNRTAADAFPNGMHSTLLEMDAVTQLQQKSRKTKHVTLAWEDHEAAERENFDDEDVPLGMLFPEKDRAGHQNVNRVVGLMEKREMEDNEPLSHRRARLRGESHQPPSQRAPSPVKSMRETESKFKLDLPGNEALEEKEDETLGQRLKRMKEEKERASAGNFASDMASQMGLETEKPAPSKTPDAEETLGQRRKRLREEAEMAGGSASQVRPGLQPRHSMADILQAYPNGVRQVSGESTNSRPGQLPRLNTFGPSQPKTNLAMPQIPAHMKTLPYYNQTPYMQPQLNGGQNMMYGYGGVPQMANPMGMNGIQYGMLADPMGPPLNSQQRAVIDRWRQGIA